VPSSILDCIAGEWSPQIGDPHLMGWVTVLAYLTTAGLAAAVATRAAAARVHPAPGLQRLFWTGIAVLYVLLAINKQLDLQSALTALGRCLALRDGWYEERKLVQLAFIGAFALSAVLFVAVLAWLLRPIVRSNRIAFLGLCLTLAFVLVRAVGFHHMDALIGVRLLGLRMNWILELSGIALVGTGAVRWLGVAGLPRDASGSVPNRL
jgi:hypothetical protein